MRAKLQNDPSAKIFSEQLLDIRNSRIELQPNTQCIKLPDNFCTVVHGKNELIQSDLMSFKSIDTVVDENESVSFSVKFLNSLDIPGMLPYNLRLKNDTPIILLRNLNPSRLYNGTRLVINKIIGNILEATILTGKIKGEVVLLPRISKSSELTIPFRRLQFPIRLAFAMSINKS
ncbi:PREDICTED: uncharacterized protein LOC107073405 [Polistes dominula]|uniref:Uncharacterized protein LOC107073405 n=1 Tax=Polistes dominula TaxID=743375 RepID=A0ABM1JAP2_POLDO|nr:PREDICTED: uncharacterized protein LOC107073405 [Polistes dominula]